MKCVEMIFICVVILLKALCPAESPNSVCNVTEQKTVGSAASAPLQMVVFGDSVEWGNGLKETNDQTPGHKFSAIVADWLSQTSGRSGKRTVYAHSAATLLAPTGIQDTGKTWPGDVDSPYPTISEQITCVPEGGRAGVQLILMNGCINDIGPFGLVSPTNSSDWVRKHTQESCGAPVEAVLRNVANLYPQATIVITGYYPIISTDSDISAFLDFLRQFCY